MLVALGAVVVRTEPERNTVRRDYGVAALRDHGNGRRTQANAEDLWHGGTKSRSSRLPLVLARSVARQPSVYRVGIEAGMGIRLALAHHRRNVVHELGIGPDSHDGSRSERYESGHRRHGSDRRHRLRRGWPGVQGPGATPAAQVGIVAVHIE